MLKCIIAALLAGTAALAWAHQEGAESNSADQPGGYDCEHPPADAVTELPGLLGTVGRMGCLPAGPGVLAGSGWSWRYTGSFFDLPTIPAYAHDEAAGLQPPFYFTRLSARELSGAAVAERNEQLQQMVETYRPQRLPDRMVAFDATNNYGQSFSAYLAMETDTNGWLVVCTPKCRPDYVILVNKLQPN